MSADEKAAKRLRTEKRKAAVQEVVRQLDLYSPSVTVERIETDEDQNLTYLALTIYCEPQFQVRMTGTSAAYMPKPMLYNGWKNRTGEAVKAALRSYRTKPFVGYIEATMWFFVSNSFRWKCADLNNAVKATEDMLNSCARQYSPEELNTWTYCTEAFPVWPDDRMVKRNGCGQGIYWEPNPEQARIQIMLRTVDVEVPCVKPKAVKRNL